MSAMVDFFTVRDVLDAPTCEQIVTELRLNGGAPALVYGKQTAGTVDLRIRTAQRVNISRETNDLVTQRLSDQQQKIQAHFGITLGHCEDLQFLCYRTGDFFVAHQDGNTPLIFDDSRFRKISFVIFLSPQSAAPAPETYCGGELVLHGPYSNPSAGRNVTADPGTLVAFRSETTHEVLPVTHGERFTIVSWYR